MTRRQRRRHRRWIANAYNNWIDHAGRKTLNTCIAETAPRDSTEDERREALALTIAESQTLHDAIMRALED